MSDKPFIRKRLIEGLMEPKPKRVAAGVLIKCEKTERVFLVLRNDKVPVWALVSGGVEEGENPLDALKREMMEELFVRAGNIQFNHVNTEQIPAKNMEFHYYEGLTNSEFNAILDHENLDWGWYLKDKLPSPLFKGLEEKIKSI
jgi:8-oxo-dGTP pyrophosphatase MutT (NUDIX family)